MKPPWEVDRPAPEIDENERADPLYRVVAEARRQKAEGRCELRGERCHGLGRDPHHVWPVSEGGPVIVPIVWLRWTCRQCHAEAHAASTRELYEHRGHIVPRTGVPSEL